MKLVKQRLSLEVDNINVEKPSKIRHSALFPYNMRCIICGPSNCGKTNVMVTLLLHKNGLRFKNVYLYTKTAYQPKYLFLLEVFRRVPQIRFMIYNNSDEVISPTEALTNSVFIFDDVACENQSNILNYFSMGRHRLIDSFYLSQTYSKIPKQLLRDNVNFLIIFKQDDINLKHIYDEHVSTDMEWSYFKSMCRMAWKDLYGFLIINKDAALDNGRYRKAFDVFITLDL